MVENPSTRIPTNCSVTYKHKYGDQLQVRPDIVASEMLTEPHRGEGLVQQGGSLLDERLSLGRSWRSLWHPIPVELVMFESKDVAVRPSVNTEIHRKNHMGLSENRVYSQ